MTSTTPDGGGRPAIEVFSNTDSEREDPGPTATDDEEAEEEDASDDSRDEYQPPSNLHDTNGRHSRSSAKRKRAEQSGRDDEDEDEDEDELLEESDSDIEEIRKLSKVPAPQPKKKFKKTSSSGSRPNHSSNATGGRKETGKGKSKAEDADDDLISDEDQKPSMYDRQSTQMAQPDSEDEREDLIRAQEAWAAVKAKREGKPIPPSKLQSGSTRDPSTSSSNPSNTLTSWLGLPDEDSIPWPTTCSSAQIKDRDSTFIGYCYPLTKASDLPLVLTHLTRKVHPLTPVDLLPTQFESAPANKRGSSHDMHAYSFLVLKRGRDGREGPDDYTLKEGKEDDGEKWASQRIEKVIKEEGASDLVCIVSRWYGGTMLGPDRFTHIENVARAAVRRFVDNETIQPLRQQILDLDSTIVDLRKTLNPSTSERSSKTSKSNTYPDLTMEKAEKLIKARKGTLAYLEKQLPKAASSSTSPSNHYVASSHEPLKKRPPSERSIVLEEKSAEKPPETGMGSGVVIAAGQSFQDQVKDHTAETGSEGINDDGVLRSKSDL